MNWLSEEGVHSLIKRVTDAVLESQSVMYEILMANDDEL